MPAFTSPLSERTGGLPWLIVVVGLLLWMLGLIPIRRGIPCMVYMPINWGGARGVNRHIYTIHGASGNPSSQRRFVVPFLSPQVGEELRHGHKMARDTDGPVFCIYCIYLGDGFPGSSKSKLLQVSRKANLDEVLVFRPRRERPFGRQKKPTE